MPGFTTHYLFGADAYKRIPNSNLRNRIKANRHAYGLGLQGPDMFFYHVPSYFLNKHNIGNVAHVERTGALFENLLAARADFSKHHSPFTLFPKKTVLAAMDAYICGFIGHYTLDTIAHPYIYAMTDYDPDFPIDGKKYFGIHNYLETELNNELLWLKKGLLPSEFHEDDTIKLSPVEQYAVSHLLGKAYRMTFPEYRMDARIAGSAARWMKVVAGLKRDPHGQKKVMVRWIEGKLFGYAVISSMVPSDRYCFFEDPFNDNRRIWVHPWSKEASAETFLELYEEAQAIFAKRIALLDTAITNEYTKKDCQTLLEAYGNLSFLSGLNLAETL